MPRELTIGMRGEDVRALQNGLNQYFGTKRKPLNPDGVFGGETLKAVHEYQRKNPGTGKRSGEPDGIVGTRTWRRLFPLAGYTVSLLGMRLRMPKLGGGGIRPPNLGPGPLRLPGPPIPEHGPFGPFPPQIDWSRHLKGMFESKIDFTPTKFPGLQMPLPIGPPRVAPVRLLETPQLQLPPLPGLGTHKLEVESGAKMGTGGPAETTFSVAVSGVYVMGDDEGAHGEFAFGTELESPALDGSGNWILSWFVQITAVDHIGKYGRFHLFQPYAQLSGENATNPVRPVLKASATPINVGFDVAKNVSVSAAAGVLFTYDPATGSVTAGVEGSAGLSVSFDMIPPRRR